MTWDLGSDYGDQPFMGDARRCPSHPNEVTSSPDGMFDAPCGQCEHESDTEGALLDALDADAAATAPMQVVRPVDDTDGADAVRWHISDDDVPF